MRKISNLVAIVLFMSFAWTQTTGKIRGTVMSSDGQPLVGANVIVDGTSKGAATDADGGFTILSVEAGTYSVSASYIGYQKSTESNVSVKVDLTFSKPDTAIPDFLDREIRAITFFNKRASTSVNKSFRTETFSFAVFRKSFFDIAFSKKIRFVFTQIPLPGSFSEISGSISLLGSTTKRIMSDL